MHATAVVVASLFCALVAPAAQASVRVLVTPIVAGDDEAARESARTLTRSVETALRAAIDDVEIVTPAALDTQVELSVARECVAGLSDDAGAVSTCMTELADAIDVDYIARPHLGRLGQELVLTLSLIAGDRAIVVAQGQRRADASSPEALLDQIPGLARAVADDADLGHVRRSGRVVPVVPIVVAGSGLVVVGAGVVGLAIRGSLSGPYGRGELGRNDARLYEGIDGPFLIGGIAAVVVGGVAAVGGAGFAIWSVVGTEE